MKKTGLLCLAMIAPGVAFADSDDHFVYTLLNQAGGNAVRSYVRKSDGHLKFLSQTYTGGLGTGHGLGSQGALTMTKDGRFVLAVNAGNNTLSMFYRHDDKLELTDIEPSGGLSPVSVTEHDGLVYVLNQGSPSVPGNIQGFARFRGGLIPIPEATWALSATGVIPVEVKFTPDGNGLVVAEKTSNLIDTYVLDYRGLPVSASYQSSNGPTPFGFDFDRMGRLYITEAFGGATNASAVSSYWLDRGLTLHTISASVATFQTAACWDVVTPNGKFVYVGNTGSGNVTGYRIDEDGALTLLRPSGVSGVTGGSTIDVATSRDGDYLYVLANGTQQITTFKVSGDGHLVKVDAVGGLPTGTCGLIGS
ncbi:MAG: lactonase family protein [Fimbriimonadaceae bacterium]